MYSKTREEAITNKYISGSINNLIKYKPFTKKLSSIENIKQGYASLLDDYVGYVLDDFIEDNFYKSKALQWAKWSVELSENDMHRPYYLSSYAHILYYTGNRAEAIKIQNLAVTLAAQKNGKYIVTKEALKSMKFFEVFLLAPPPPMIINKEK